MSEAILKELLAEVKSLRSKLDAIAPVVLKTADIATAAQLDGEKGDPDVPFDPKAWRGESYKGRRFSEAPAELLDMLGDFFEWSARNPKEGKEQYAGIDRRKASLAYGWAYRKRTGGQGTAPGRSTAPRQTSGGGYGGGYGSGNASGASAGGGYGGGGGGYGGRSNPTPPADQGPPGNDDDIPFAVDSISHDLHRWGL